MPFVSPVVFAEMENSAVCAELAESFVAVTESHFAPSVVDAAATTLTGAAELTPTSSNCERGWAPDAAPSKKNPPLVGSGAAGAPAAPTSKTPARYCGEF